MANPKNKKNEEPATPAAPPAVTESESPAAQPVEEAPIAPDPVVASDAPVEEPPVEEPAPEPPIEEEYAREGFVFLFAPEGVTGCSVNGVEYQADADGVVEVPSEHVAELVGHGFESAGI